MAGLPEQPLECLPRLANLGGPPITAWLLLQGSRPTTFRRHYHILFLHGESGQDARLLRHRHRRRTAHPQHRVGAANHPALRLAGDDAPSAASIAASSSAPCWSCLPGPDCRCCSARRQAKHLPHARHCGANSASCRAARRLHRRRRCSRALPGCQPDSARSAIVSRSPGDCSRPKPPSRSVPSAE